MTVLFDGSLFADYHQFYLADPAQQGDLPTGWTDATLTARLLVGKRSITVSTARNMTVPVRVELHERAPLVDENKADHVVTASFWTSGEIAIAGMTDFGPTAFRAKVPPGNLCAMVVSTGLGTLSWNGLEGDDRYVVHLWPCKANGVTVLRQWIDK